MEYEIVVAEDATRYSRYVVTATSEEEARTKMTGYFEDVNSIDARDITYNGSETELDNDYRIIEVKEW